MGIDKKDKKQVNYYPKSKPLSQKALVTSCHYFLSPMTPVGTENPQHYAVHTQKDKLLHIAWSKISAHWAWVGGERDLKSILWSKFWHLGGCKAACHIWRPLLSAEVPPAHKCTELHYDLLPDLSPHMSDAAELRSAEQLSRGGKRHGTAQQGWWCSKDAAWRYLPSCNPELKPKPSTKPREADSPSCRVI